MRNERTWNLIGVALGILVILMGIVFMCTPPEAYSTDSADTASFGGDYYTYQYKATRIVARNAAVTANNIRELGAAVATYAGALFIVMGALITLEYSKKLALAAPAEAKVPEEVPEIPAPAVNAAEE